MASFLNVPRIKYDVPDDARAILVILHGMAEYSDRYRPAIEFFNAHGIGCATFDQRGHGKAPDNERDRGHIESYDEIVGDAANVMGAVRSLYPALPLFVWGHSMGAITAVLAAAALAKTTPGRIRGVITSSAPIAAFDSVPRFVVSALRMLANVLPRKRVARPFKPERLSRDLQVGLRYGADPLVPKAITLRLLTELAFACERSVQIARKLRVPWLALHGIDDEIAPAVGSQRLIDALSGDDKYLHVWPGARHEVHNEIEPTRTEFLTRMVEWMNERA